MSQRHPTNHEIAQFRLMGQSRKLKADHTFDPQER